MTAKLSLPALETRVQQGIGGLPLIDQNRDVSTPEVAKRIDLTATRAKSRHCQVGIDPIQLILLIAIIVVSVIENIRTEGD
ncbi:hypothetical protein [Methylomonas albis]|uniref:Uncharacterized protein n=1 Tax=Methylomonas albis TaxID=1854563 RepID=A0ABR9CZW3_9GAMM|nr:hypothetical protein [Methylomonas albis]MBD9356280.1 hypothetical protein [Methylomonas albis]